MFQDKPRYCRRRITFFLPPLCLFFFSPQKKIRPRFVCSSFIGRSRWVETVDVKHVSKLTNRRYRRVPLQGGGTEVFRRRR